jgi:hypothetical protein
VTAQGEDILAWTDRAISVREAAATAAAFPYGRHWVQGFPEKHKDPEMRYAWDADMVHLSEDDPHIAYQCLSDEIAALTVLNDPASVLRRCAADRKLLKLHRLDGGWSCVVCAAEEREEEDTEGQIERSRPAIDFPCPTLRAVAEGYGWTGGER